MGKQRRRDRGTESTSQPPSAAAGPSVGIEAWIRRSWFAPALFALIALVYFAEFPLSDKVIFGGDVGHDFHKGKAPVLEKLKDLVPSAWDRRMGGYPISEEIRHKFFPTYLIELFTTKQRAIGWRYLLAVFGAGWGMFLYLRQIGVGQWAALWGGLAFLCAPTFLSFPYAGQYAKMTVIALFPFLCLCVERGMDEGVRGARWWILMSFLIALGVFSPHLQMLQYALLGMGLYFLYKVTEFVRRGMDRPALAQRVGLFAVAVVLGLGLGAEGVFPPYLHVKTQSKRAAIQDEVGRSEAEQLAHARSWSLHPEEMASLVVPEFGGFDDPKDDTHRYWGRNAMKLNSEYFGIIALIMGLVAVSWARSRLLVMFLAALFILVASFTIGEHTPVHWLAYHLMPGGKVLRTIGMAAFLFAFPAIVLAAITLSRALAAKAEDRAELSRRVLIVGGGISGLVLLLAIAPGPLQEAWSALFWSDMPAGRRQAMLAGSAWLSRGALLVALVAAIATLLLYLRVNARIGSIPVVLGLAALTLFDTWRIDRLFLHYEEPARWTDFRKANPATVGFLQDQPEKFRVYPLPSHDFLNGGPQFHLAGVDVVSAFNNYTLRRYDRLLKEFSPVENAFRAKFRGQNVPYTDDQLLEAIRPLLNLVNARYVVTPRPIVLETEGFPEVFAAEGVRLYENNQALPWVQLIPHAVVEEGESQILQALRAGAVNLSNTVILEKPPQLPLPGTTADQAGDTVVLQAYDYHEGRISLQVHSQGARMLVISDNYHPNWSASVDGVPVEIVRANYVWRAIPLPAGEHLVEFSYHSTPVAIARGTSLASLLVLLLWGGFTFRRKAAVESAG